MPKLKTKSSIKKRFSRTGTGKIKFKPSGKGMVWASEATNLSVILNDQV